MARILTLKCTALLLSMLALSSVITAQQESEVSHELELLVLEAEKMIYSDPSKLDSLVLEIESKSLAINDSATFVQGLTLRGIRSTMSGDYGPALKSFYDVWQYSKRNGDTAMQVNSLINMAGVCQMSGRYLDTKKRLVLAKSMIDQETDKQLMGSISMALGIAEVELQQFDSAVNNFKIAVELFDEVEDQHSVLACMSEMGYALEAQHRYREAYDIYKRMDVLYKFTSDITGEIVANQRKGNALMHMGRMYDATEVLEYSLALADSADYQNQKDTTLLRLIKANASIGNMAGAEKYTKQLVAFIEDREQRKNHELVAFVEAKYNLDEKSRINASLTRELAIAREDFQRTQLYLRFAVAAIVVLFLSIVVMFGRLSTVYQRT